MSNSEVNSLPVDQFMAMGAPSCLKNIGGPHSAECHRNYCPTQEALNEKNRLEDQLLAICDVCLITGQESYYDAEGAVGESDNTADHVGESEQCDS